MARALFMDQFLVIVRRLEEEIKFPFKRNGLPCFENAKTFPLHMYTHGLTDNNNAVTSPSMYRMKTFR